MQHPRPPQLPPLCSSFKKHRYSIDNTTRFALDLTLPKPLAAPAWASLPTPPMSGSPPPEPPAEPPQIAGRRRKRSHTPPVVTAATAAHATSPATPLEHHAPRFGAQGRAGDPAGEFGAYPAPYAPFPPLAAYQSSSSLPAASTTTVPPESRYGPASLSPRSTRKPKAHVASACVNCKKKHLRCDNSRPCRRCVQGGKEASCADVEHKKRGRPPLKPEDPAIQRPFDTALSPFNGPPPHPPRPGRGSDPAAFAQVPSYQRAMRPLQPLTDPSRPPQLRGPMFQPPMYAPPSISPSSATATGTFVPPTRPYPPSPMPIPGQLPPHSPPLPESLRPMPSFPASYDYPGAQASLGGPAPYRYSTPIFPRATGPPPLAVEPQLPPLQHPSSLQLPPIRPTGPLPAAVDPPMPRPFSYPAPRDEGEGRDDGTREPNAKRPKMDIQGILGPRND